MAPRLLVTKSSSPSGGAQKTIVIVYSRGVLQPSGSGGLGLGIGDWSEPGISTSAVLGNGEPLIKLLGNALTFERVLQRRPPIIHLPLTTDWPRMRYQTCQQRRNARGVPILPAALA